MSALVTTILILVAVTAGIADLRYRRIPNWLTVTGVVLGLSVNCLPGQDGFKVALFGLGCALAVYVPLFLVRGMGAGDVKLMAAVGALAGAANWIGIFLATALIGGVGALVLVAKRRRWRETSSNLAVICGELLAHRSPADAAGELDYRNPKSLRMPHGAFIALGVLTFLVVSRVASIAFIFH